MDKLPPFQYSLDAPSLTLTPSEITRLIRKDPIQLDTRRTWIQPAQELGMKMAFYREHLLQLTEDGFVIRRGYMDTHLSHGIRCAIGQLSQSGQQEAPTGDDMRAAVWEVCGNSSALELLTDLISTRLLELEEGTGTETSDQKIFSSVCEEPHSSSAISKNIKSCTVYRKGQKYLAKQFLKESKHLLELSLSEEADGRNLRQIHGPERP
ncbi:hypothetical protein L7F22_035539 [Adiantum nelumboides]|nr:hypothetical protein [Adiantum nelumboides]